MPGPLGYPSDSEQLANTDIPSRLESWEIENNNTENVKFQSSNFDGEAWKDDFEARIPNKYYVYDKIKEFTDFVSSCNMHKATNSLFPTSITFRIDSNYAFKDFTQSEGKYSYTTENNIYKITFTHDTACYRLCRFKALAPEYMQMESFCWYYIWAFMFLAADSYAKNLFIGFRGDEVDPNGPVLSYKRKACAEVYDADTILGIDNLGNLVLSPFLIDTDYVIQNADASEFPRTDDSTQEKVFDAQDTVLFENIRIAFWDTCRQILVDAIEAGFTAENVIVRFRAHRNKWSASIYNADANSTYIYPHIHKVKHSVTKEINYDHTYLPKLLGDKDSQMAWFTRKRWRYVSSMYTVGDANNVFISFRVSRAGSITLWPVHDLYVGMRFGEGGLNQVLRVFAGGSATFTLDSGDADISRYECRVFSGDLIKKIEGLTEMKAAYVNFSMATSLQEIVLGGPEGNTYLNDFSADNCPLLKKLDLSNCPNVTGEIRLENSTILEQCYLEGTSISSVALAEGCLISTLHLPGTINSLILIDLPNLTDLQIESYSNIRTFFFKDVNSAVDLFGIMENLSPNTAINIDFDIELNSSEDVYDLFDIFDTMRGVYRQKTSTGTWNYIREEEDPENPGQMKTLNAQVSGVIHLDSVNGSDVAAWNTRYPYVVIDAANSTAVVTFKTWDGSETVGNTLTAVNGTLQGTPPTVPARSATAQYTFSPEGWSSARDDDTHRPEALRNIVMDTTLYAAYSRYIRQYTVTWSYYIEEELHTDTQTVSYGVKPVFTGSTPTQGGVPYTGWYPAVSEVTGDVTYIAQYKPIYTATFVLSADHGGGTLATVAVAEGNVASYSGATPVSSKGSAEELEFIGWTPAFLAMYSDVTYTAVFRDNRSVVIKYLNGDLTEYESSNVNKVSEYVFIANKNLEVVDLANTNPVTILENAFNGCTDLLHLIIRSRSMATLSNTNAFTGTAIANKVGTVYVPADLVDTYLADTNWKNYIIMPISAYPYDAIGAQWEEVINNTTTYATDYAIGKTLPIMYNGTVHLMELVAIDADDKADGSGKARMTWICKDLITTHNMNSSGTNANGWPATAMRSWLRSDVLSLLPEVLQNNIVEVTKTYYNYTTGSTLSTSDTIWIPSAREIFGGTSYEDSGVDYTSKFNSSTNRKKTFNGSAYYWWSRSAYSGLSSYFMFVYSDGNASSSNASYTHGVAPGFCI